MRGRNTIFVVEVHGLRIARLGDLGNVLTLQMFQGIGAIDILLLPVGGSYTLDTAIDTEVVEQLNPRAIIPMLFQTGRVRALNHS